MMSFYAPDALWESPPLGTSFEGRAAMRGFVEGWMDAYEEWQAKPQGFSISAAEWYLPWSAITVLQPAPSVTFSSGRGGCSCGWTA